MPSLSKVLIANRGEIAVRIARAVRAEGMVPVTCHTVDDASSPHVGAADETVALPGTGPAGYLDIAAVVTAAVESGCDAIHPGYGFLSENETFARTVGQAGLTFVGPGPDQLRRFGDKAEARAAASAAGVPVLSATEGGVDLDTARTFLQEHGAVMLKAVAGGGGRGMRPVRDLDALEEAFAACSREAEAAFGDGALYAEELLADARHVEVQIVGDGVRVEHCHERECSLQRSRQKLIEFAPAWWLDADLRRALHDAAVRLGERVAYDSVGTVEFLVSGDRFAFIELNPRIQVEHTVTEEVCGIDLVRFQLRLAKGESLGALDLFSPPRLDGFAVQARVNMETLGAGGQMVPTGGVIETFTPPPGVRVDTFAAVGYETSPRYDSLLAKVVVRHGDHTKVLGAAADALDALVIEGVETNRTLLATILREPDLEVGRFDTTWLETHLARLAPAAAPVGETSTGQTQTDQTDTGQTGGTGQIAAPLQGTIVRFEVAVGDEVPAGAPVAIMEAMKMEHVVTATGSGIVRSLGASVGDAVVAGHPLLTVEPAEVAARVEAVEDDVDLDHIRPDLAEVIERHAHGLDENRPDAVAKRRKLGKRTARENVADLLDDGSLIEYGALVVAAQRKRRSEEELREKTPADGMIGGVGTVGGHSVAVASYDYTVLAGTQGLNNHRKKDRLFEIAEHQRLPFVFFTEGGGGRPGDTDGTGVAGLDCLAFAYFGRLSGLVPLVGIASGRCFAGNAAILGCCDVVIATADANIGMGGPAMIEGGGLGVYRPEEVGPIDDQIASGVVDIAVADEAEAVAVATKYLSYFLDPVLEGSAHDHADQRLLRRAIPENRLRVYEVRNVIETLFDTDSVLELRRGFGAGMVTALARIDGRAVGVIANDPTHLAGAIDSDGADKAARFMQLCDAHDLPIVFLCDTPGIMVGPEAERTGLVRHASRLFVTAGGLTVPYMTVVLRKGYGLGAQAMAGGSFHAPSFIVGWPTSEFGGMGLEGAVRLGYRNELAAIEDPDERERTFQEMVARMYEVGKGVRMAEAFEIDDVIDPADTRRWINAGLAAAPAPTPRSGKKRPNIDTW
ncbi:carboxyl transferase domain-containing protein [Actinospongicola halichondriae]|uniref:acetyl-CoA carboxylase family protein n=1 Tax=Actinospongicola halichondriae TaxID=3236844 RepID=UPI003D559A5F